MILYPILGQLVDHENGNGLDNRRTNLRIATTSQNNRNTALRSTNSSGYKGVSWNNENQRWKAQIQTDGTKTFLGYFDDLLDAAQAYNDAALEQHGEFARLNEYV